MLRLATNEFPSGPFPAAVEAIAAQAGCPARSLAATFRAHGGRTVTAALRDLRLDAARAALLGGPGRGVAEVAAVYGFSLSDKMWRKCIFDIGQLEG